MRSCAGANGSSSQYPVRDLPVGHMVYLPGRGSTYVTDSGPKDKPTIFLLHSVMTNGLLCWYPLIPELNKEFRVITLDQRWHGRGIRDKPFDLDDCADDVVALADVLGIETFTAAGFSMGGGVAQLAWHRHPGRVDGLILCSTGPFFGSHDPKRQTSMSNIGRVMKMIHPPHVRPNAAKLDDRTVPDSLWAMRQFLATPAFAARDHSATAWSVFDSRPWLSEIDVPSAVLISTRDRVIPPCAPATARRQHPRYQDLRGPRRSRLLCPRSRPVRPGVPGGSPGRRRAVPVASEA